MNKIISLVFRSQSKLCNHMNHLYLECTIKTPYSTTCHRLTIRDKVCILNIQYTSLLLRISSMLPPLSDRVAFSKPSEPE